jgi:transposase
MNLPDKPSFRPDEAAAILGVSRRTVYRKLRKGELEAVGKREGLAGPGQRVSRPSLLKAVQRGMEDDPDGIDC